MDPVTAVFLALGVLSMFSGSEKGASVESRIRHFIPSADEGIMNKLTKTKEYQDMMYLKHAMDKSYYTKNNFENMKKVDKGGIFSNIFFGLFDDLIPISDWIHANDKRNNFGTADHYVDHSLKGGKALADKYNNSVDAVKERYNELQNEGRNDLLMAQGLVKL